MQYTKEQLAEILKKHSLWLETDGQEGSRANLSDANLTGANLIGAIMSGANLKGAYLPSTSLFKADLK